MSTVLALPQVKDFLKTLAKGKEKEQEQRKEHDVNVQAVIEEGEPSKKPWDEDIPELFSPSYSPPTSFSYSSDSSSSSNPRRRSGAVLFHKQGELRCKSNLNKPIKSPIQGSKGVYDANLKGSVAALTKVLSEDETVIAAGLTNIKNKMLDN
ncbi:hypothetical protein L7F22_062283 [Adiantum nelumboides]|nr:hypothetical protein [Adiantum nelumboides]